MTTSLTSKHAEFTKALQAVVVTEGETGGMAW